MTHYLTIPDIVYRHPSCGGAGVAVSCFVRPPWTWIVATGRGPLTRRSRIQPRRVAALMLIFEGVSQSAARPPRSAVRDGTSFRSSGLTSPASMYRRQNPGLAHSAHIVAVLGYISLCAHVAAGIENRGVVAMGVRRAP